MRSYGVRADVASALPQGGDASAMIRSPRDEWIDDCFAGFTAYYLTSLPVFLGLLLGIDFPRRGEDLAVPPADLVSACIRFDALHYLEIVREGYSYDPDRRSVVAFFPAYPLLSRAVSEATGLSAEEAALLTAHIALLVAFVLLARYVRLRWPEATSSLGGFSPAARPSIGLINCEYSCSAMAKGLARPIRLLAVVGCNGRKPVSDSGRALATLKFSSHLSRNARLPRKDVSDGELRGQRNKREPFPRRRVRL